MVEYTAQVQIELNEQFAKAIELLEGSSQHLFITGKAGTGKSTLLSYFIEHTKKECAVLAPTGVAALNVGGETIHSFFGFKPNVTCESARKKAKGQTKSLLYKEITTIVIDEISMVRADLLDCVDVFLRVARANKEPFGGVQMVFIGDLYQLPPVVTSDDRDFFRDQYASPWFFDSHVFTDERFSMSFVELEKMYRQKQEQFIELLNAVRTNTVDDRHMERLNARWHKGASDAAPELSDHIHLTTTNAGAREINDARLAGLKSKVRSFSGESEGSVEGNQLPTDMHLELKSGAQVMFVNNDPAGRWVNGSVGRVTALHEDFVTVQIHDGELVEVDPHTWDMYRYVYNSEERTLSQKKAGSFTQLPLKLAWAITIHKSQGKTFDKVIVDMGNGSFASGQTYVALSRCRTFEGVVLKKPIKKSDVRIDWKVQKFLTQYQYRLSERSCPLDEKVALLNEAITKGAAIDITYLKAKDVKSRRRISPRSLGERTYLGKKFLGVDAWCFSREDVRVFRVDRILEIRPV